MRFLPQKIQVVCNQLRQLSARSLCKTEQVEYQPSGYKSGNTPPENGWLPYPAGTVLSGSDAHYWLRAQLVTPPEEEYCYYCVHCTTGLEGQRDTTRPQGLIYLNGIPVQGMDTNHTEIYLEPNTAYTLHNYFYMSMPDIPVPVNMELFLHDSRLEQLYYDISVPLASCLLLPENHDDRRLILDVLEQTVNRIDLRQPYSQAFFSSVADAQTYITRELYEKLCTPEGKPIIACIGHTHIDVEWLWARAQTREKVQRSFANALKLMERYPEYLFMLSQPELYRYLKEEDPAQYEKLKSLVAQGRWEPEGAMWVESDCNLISGESFVRQILQGKQFFRKEFGVDCKILFLPDVFGYSAAMPQILLKSGIRYFVTSKISWNDTNMLPVDCFLWQGIDGSEIFTNFITTQPYQGEQCQTYTTYVGHLTPAEIKGTWNRFQQKDYANRAMTTYGWGDGGGGPTAEMLETQRRLAKGLPGMPVTQMSTLRNHLDKVREEFDTACLRTGRIPKWVGELYLEFHRGTYTSMARNKRSNRKCEFGLQTAEALSAQDLLRGGSYDAEGLYHNWNLVLHNQFHDIIPGSSIQEVYDGTDLDYARIESYYEYVIRQKLQNLAQQVDADSGTLVYNPTGFDRRGEVMIGGQMTEPETVIPAFGWKVLPVIPTSCQVTLTGLTAENPHYVLTLSPSGSIASLWDKQSQREVFLPGQEGNQLQIFEDLPRDYDNWEISDYYKAKMWLLNEPARIEPITDGSRAGFRVCKTYLSSTITQHIWLYSQGRRIDFETEIDWHEHHQILKAAFPLDVHATQATYEIQFGHVTRPTHENTSWDQAKFEVYGHKWVDLSENGYGISLLNDCKYGFNAEGSTLKLTILKCGTFPNPQADQGLHRFTYSLLPHAGDFREAGVIQESYCLNQPLLAVPVKNSAGRLPAQNSLAACDKDNIILTNVKKAEADDGIILRMYEAFDRRTDFMLTLQPGFSGAFLCDLMENELQPLIISNNTIALHANNFEILTVKLVP